ncbi:MAG: ABC transporter substrate-binding protein [Chloroflexota bacterium]
MSLQPRAKEQTQLGRWQILLYLVLVLAISGLLAACGGDVPELPTEREEEPAAADSADSSDSDDSSDGGDMAMGDGNEAPALAAMVAAGDLPPVEERLPSEPMIVEVWDSIGQYGGTWRSGLLGQADRPWVGRTMGYEPLLRWAPDLTTTIPNVAKDWEVNEEGTEFTFFLREGMKWSDGHPFTADDFVFWYEKEVLSDDLTPVKPIWMRPGGELGTVEKIDDTTVKFSFAAPHGLFLSHMGNRVPFVPAHYAEQWHIDFDAEAVEAAVAAEEQEDWVALYRSKLDYLNSVDRPVIFAWQVTTPASSATQVVAERNPYYWKTDPEGNQLPYIDKLVYPIVESVDVLVLKALSGEVDMMDRHIATPANKSIFFDSKADGEFDFFTVDYAWETPVSIGFNLSHKDEALRDIFNEKDFRVAMSLAINRQEIIDAVYVGDGEPRQSAPLAESPHFHEQLAYQYTEHDVEMANELLDGLGLERGDDGIRLRPDGEPLSFTIEVVAAFEPWADIMELVSVYWKEVGVDSNVQVLERSLFYERKAAYEHTVIVWTGADGIALVMDPRSYMPYSRESLFGVAWADWWQSDGAQGDEPPEAAQKQQELFEQLQVTVGDEAQAAIMTEILDIAAEEFWVMGITKYYKGYGIVKNNFKNVPETVWQWHVSSAPAQTNPEQYYIEQ